MSLPPSAQPSLHRGASSVSCWVAVTEAAEAKAAAAAEKGISVVQRTLLDPQAWGQDPGSCDDAVIGVQVASSVWGPHRPPGGGSSSECFHHPCGACWLVIGELGCPWSNPKSGLPECTRNFVHVISK
jgi:hypothetical protein